MGPYIPTSTRPQAISSVYGKIDQILLSFPGGQVQVETGMIIKRYTEFFNVFGDRVHFVIMGNFGSQIQAIKRELESKNHYPDLVDTPMGLERKHGEFVQDSFLMMRSRFGEPLLLEQYRNYQHKNAFLAEQYADAMGIPILPTRFAIEGGNVLVGDDYALIGRNVLEKNRKLYYDGRDELEAEHQLREAFKALLGLRFVYFIGSDKRLDYAARHYPEYQEARQPFFHLDLYLTLGGKDKRGDEIILLAEIDIESVGKYLTAKQVELLENINATLKKVKEELESISESSFGPRFLIEEIPMSGRFDIVNGKEGFIPYSYNNAQVEWYHGISRIYLPKYAGCERLENRLRENLPGLGFSRLYFVEYAFSEYAKENGSLHCLTKVMRRGNY